MGLSGRNAMVTGGASGIGRAICLRLARVGAAVERVHAALGPVHVLVNDAGIAGLVPLQEMTEDQWDRMIAVHLKGAFNCTRAVLGDMTAAGWGRIVNVSSVAGL